ncbi:hypothetical protein [Treponema sp.]|uniref:hypothetical protein n=1 Tax=Treponema sp. TaxID=166 RepID=UPI003FA236CE
MRKRTIAVYGLALIYELCKVFYIAAASFHSKPEILLFRYIELAAVCVPVLPWLMLALNEKAFYWALYAAALCKLSSVCAQFLYIFHRGFAIMEIIFTSVQKDGSLDFSREVFFFLAADTVLLFYSFMKGSVYHANNTGC